jgi:hypothetical protein
LKKNFQVPERVPLSALVAAHYGSAAQKLLAELMDAVTAPWGRLTASPMAARSNMGRDLAIK